MFLTRITQVFQFEKKPLELVKILGNQQSNTISGGPVRYLGD